MVSPSLRFAPFGRADRASADRRSRPTSTLSLLSRQPAGAAFGGVHGHRDYTEMGLFS